MTAPNFLAGSFQIENSEGAVLEHPHDHLFGKVLGLLFVHDCSSSQLTAFLHHTQQFYNRVNGVENKSFTGKRAHNLEVVVIPSPSLDETTLQQWMNNLSSPFLQVSPKEGNKLVELISKYPLEEDEVALQIVNWDGSVITRQGLVDVLSKGDSCLMHWHMVRKTEPIAGAEDAPVTVPGPTAAPPSSKTVVGGVAVDLPF
ncbi:hypothetical protein TrST_g8411 [Triparma strigata]|uniref:Uncharacterized protein n=1 Tax=Triparma strigata TaxID=1606541 RepID=A0A9W7BS20_9STRA|nr:hypothetical protein TrST_g8411 [Triparma strigata]